MQQQLMAAQQEMAQAEVTGQAGGGLVVATVKGTGEVVGLQIDPKVVDPEDVETLQDLVIGAIEDASRKAQEVAAEKLGPLAGGLGGGLPERVYEGPVQDLIDELGKLPGVGPKSAQRIAFHLLSVEPPEIDRLKNALQRIRDGVQFCTVCGTVSDQEKCRICADARRDRTVICVVEEPKDVQAVERTREFKGRYHVLGGALNPLSGIGPDQLRIRELLARIANQEDGVDVSEVIIATDPNTEGEATATYLVRMMRDIPGLTVSRLASGLPMGGDLEFADELTLGRALSGRREFGTEQGQQVRRTSEQTRAQIIASAGKAFATRPYREITLKDIAEDAGVSAPLIIKYFGSKEQLYDELVDFRAAAVTVFDAPNDSLGERMVS
eukprot:gene27193-32753_t